ncbi:MAG: secondary thiamine-phosphate synthase enzyme YjbQ [Oscillospiraceae bacterium]|jgi:secondary thiamine-phosphate synthase enzyme
MTEIALETKKDEWVMITGEVRRAVQEAGVQAGLCLVYCPHTTAGITVNENADPDVVRDLKLALEASFPDRPEFRHFEGNSAAHLKASVIGTSVALPVQGGQLQLGRWQGIYFCEFDGPRRRTVHIQVLGT